MATTSDDRPTDTQPNGGDMVKFDLSVVTLIDLLGQSSELARWDSVPGPEQMADWLSAVRQSMGRVLSWREQFERSFRQFQAHRDRLAEQLSENLPAGPRRGFDEYRETSLNTSHFSDTLIFDSPLQNEQGYWQVANIVSMVATCGRLMLIALTMKAAFRGAIEVGMLGQFPATGEPYGPAMAKAHSLEAKVADYPRIIVGPGLISYLHTMSRNPDTSWPAQLNQALAKLCQKHIAQDTDGYWIVDYLSPEWPDNVANPSVTHTYQSQAHAFVQAELDRFTKEGNEKLAKRYERLLTYFRSRGAT